MGYVARFLERRAHPGLSQNWAKFFDLKNETAAGVHVDQQTGMQQSTVSACVRVISETSAMLPLILYKRLPRGKDRAVDHRLYNILHYLPNPEMTSIELRETLMGHVGLWGNAFAEIEWSNGGWVKALWPLRPDKMRVIRRGGKLIYVYTMPPNSPMPYVELPFQRVLHIRGLGFDGTVGYDPIFLARQAIGLAMATEEFGSRFFGNGAQTGTIYEHPAKLKDEVYDRLKRSIEQRHQGLENAHRVMILEEGMKAHQVGIPPENAQFLETRKFQVPEIARFYRMPLHKIGYLENATYSNIEHQALEFVTDTLQPWLIRWEQAIYRDLLSPAERTTFFAEHLVDGLLRGDTQARYTAYNIGRNGGWLSANDIREKENMNPVEGGDVYLVPLNMIPATMVGEDFASQSEKARPGEDPPQGDPPQGDADPNEQPARSWERRGLGSPEVETRARKKARGRQRLASSFQRMFQDAGGRVIRREVADVKRAVKKYLGQRGAPDFSLWLNEFYAEHKDFWKRQMMPILLSYADQIGINVADELGGDPAGPDAIRAFIEAYVDALAARQVGESIGQLKNLLDRALQDNEDPAEKIEERLDIWEENRPGQMARDESSQANNALAKAFYVLAGIIRLRWVATGDTCPYCRDLDGKVVGIQKFFVEANVDYQPDGADRPLKSRHNVGHPPVHDGCDCMVVAERG